MRLLLRCLFFLICAAGVWAQAVEWTASLSTTRCNVGEQVVLELKLSGQDSDPLEPSLPAMAGLEVTFAGASKSMSMVNGVTSSSSTFSYILTPNRTGDLVVPGIPISVDGTTYTTQPQHVVVGSSSGIPSSFPSPPPLFGPPQTGSPWGGPQSQVPQQPPAVTAQPVLVECEVSTQRPYVNQLVIYTFRFLHRVGLQGNPNYEPAPATGFLKEDLGQSTSTTERDGVTYSVSEVKTAFFPTSPGKLTIGATRLTCQLSNLDPFDVSTLYSDPVRELATQPIELDVLPLPTQNRPPSFNGAVGNHFEMHASLNRSQLKAGEPVKLELTIKGDGHPDLILDPTVPNWPGIRLYACESQSPPFEKPVYQASKTFKIPMVPQEPGKFSLSNLSWSYFDPGQHNYVTLTADPMALQVDGVALPGVNKTPGPGQPASTPLSGPVLGADPPNRWADNPVVAVVALTPWVLSLMLLTLGHLQEQLQQSQQTPQARLRRLAKKVARARSLEELSQLAYQGLEIQLDMPLHGLPFVRLRELLSAEMVDQLEQAEAARYAPQAEADEKRMEVFRRLLLQELRRGRP